MGVEAARTTAARRCFPQVAHGSVGVMAPSKLYLGKSWGASAATVRASATMATVVHTGVSSEGSGDLEGSECYGDMKGLASYEGLEGLTGSEGYVESPLICKGSKSRNN